MRRTSILEEHDLGNGGRDMSAEIRQQLSVALDTTQPIDVRVAATRRLGELGDDSIAVQLGAIACEAREDEALLKEAVGKTMRMISATRRLVADLRAPDPSVRARTARILGAVADAAAIPALIVALSDTDRKVRAQAASALIPFGSKLALPALKSMLFEDPHPSPRGAAAQALAEIDDQDALDALELATRCEEDVYTIILIERAILRFEQRRSN
jgi:hypothetical protein